MYDHITFSFTDLEDLLVQVGNNLASYGFTVDHNANKYLHFHGASDEHYHIQNYTSSYNGQRALRGGLCTGFTANANYTSQPGKLAQQLDTGSMYTTASAGDNWTMSGNAHVFLATGKVWVFYSLVHDTSVHPVWGSFALGKITSIAGTYTTSPRFAGCLIMSELDDDGDIQLTKGTLFSGSTSKVRQLIAGYSGAPSDNGHSSYFGSTGGKFFYQPETIAQGAVYSAGTQGGYQIFEPLEFWVNNPNKEAFLAGVEEDVHFMSGQGRVPFEEFTISSKKYLFCPAGAKMGMQHFGYAIHIN